MARREPRAGLDETGVPGRNRDRQAGADHGALPRSELDALARRQIEPGVALVRPRGQRRAGVEALHRQPGHAPFRRRLGASSAMRYDA